MKVRCIINNTGEALRTFEYKELEKVFWEDLELQDIRHMEK